MVIVLHPKDKEVGCSQKPKPIGNKALVIRKMFLRIMMGSLDYYSKVLTCGANEVCDSRDPFLTHVQGA